MTDLGGCLNVRKGKPCGRLAQIRGLCTACYQNACHKIRAGKTTWAKEMAAGRALPPRRGLWFNLTSSRKIKEG